MMKQIDTQALISRGHTLNRAVPPPAALPPFSGAMHGTDAILSAQERLNKRTHIMLDRTGAIIAIGEQAKSKIAELNCYSIIDGRLVGNKTDAKEPLERMLKLDAGAVDSAIIPCNTLRGHVLLSATGLCQDTILVSLHIASPGHGAELVDLTKAFGLTPSEAHIVELLLGGHGPSKISEELNISVHTVRAHLRHCYDKLGVSSREELWQTLAPYQI